MYSYEERMRAVQLYIQYDFHVRSVMRELGYPKERHVIPTWYKEFKKNGDLKHECKRRSKFTDEQKSEALKYYFEHGMCLATTVRALGFPSRQVLQQWVCEVRPDLQRHCTSSRSLVHLTPDEKNQVAIELCYRDGTVQALAEKYGVSRWSIYNCKWQLLGKEKESAMPKRKKKVVAAMQSSDVTELQNQVEQLQQLTANLKNQASDLEQQVHRLQLEKDVLEKAAELIKKDQGVSLDILTNHEKAIVIGALRNRYPLRELLSVFRMAKSSYCYQETQLQAADKYQELREKIRSAFDSSRKTYGYRRIHFVLKADGIRISEKVVRRIMQEDGLTVYLRKRKTYSSYQGEISPAVPNLLERNFHSSEPNQKWLTDITEFAIPAGKVYLSPILDCFDGLPVSWTIGTSPNAELANTMLDRAIQTLKSDEKPIVHSDRGAHYRWPGWIHRMDQAGLTRSMSKKGCSPDNSACEGFFGRLKNEMFYGHDWRGVTLEQFIDCVDDYIKWYASKRIKLSLGGMSPIDYRKSLGLSI